MAKTALRLLRDGSMGELDQILTWCTRRATVVIVFSLTTPPAHPPRICVKWVPFSLGNRAHFVSKMGLFSAFSPKRPLSCPFDDTMKRTSDRAKAAYRVQLPHPMRALALALSFCFLGCSVFTKENLQIFQGFSFLADLRLQKPWPSTELKTPEIQKIGRKIGKIYRKNRPNIGKT